MLRLIAEGLADTAFKFGYGLACRLGPGGTAGEALHLPFPEGAAYPQDNVLPDAQRADDGTVDASADEGQQHQRDYDGHVECEAGGQELELGHPAKPLPPYAGKEQRDADEEDGCERDSGFL